MEVGRGCSSEVTPQECCLGMGVCSLGVFSASDMFGLRLCGAPVKLPSASCAPVLVIVCTQVVSDVQALAFYLPGIASSLSKQIFAATGGWGHVHVGSWSCCCVSFSIHHRRVGALQLLAARRLAVLVLMEMCCGGAQQELNRQHCPHLVSTTACCLQMHASHHMAHYLPAHV